MPLFDMHMVLTIAGIALLGGIIGLDRTAVGQIMISQPIVAAPLIGWVLGDATTGLIVGAALELIWLLDIPVGSFVPADSTVAAVFATAIAILGSPGNERLSLTGFSILLTVLLAPITMRADTVIRNFNSRLAHRIQASSEEALGAILSRAHRAGLGVFFLKFFLLYLLLVPMGMIAVRLFTHAPETYHRAMTFYVKVLPLLGAALVVRKLSMKTVDHFLLGGFVMVAVLVQFVHAPALMIMLLIITGASLGARYRERQS
jgi:mannose/fructose/N-acetylgalactosamine-specific phosphotransferase system component IIC